MTVPSLGAIGGIELTVPEGTEVDAQVIPIFGGVDVGKLAPPTPDLPVLRLRGVCGFGGVDIRHPKLRKRRDSN